MESFPETVRCIRTEQNMETDRCIALIEGTRARLGTTVQQNADVRVELFAQSIEQPTVSCRANEFELRVKRLWAYS